MIAQQVASKAARDGFFLEQVSVQWLPLMMVFGSAVSLVVAVLVGRALSTFSPARVAPLLYALSGTLYLAEAFAVDRFPKVVAVVLFLHTMGLGAAVVSGFWSVVNESFDPYAARRAVGRIVVGTTLGGAMGGGLTWLASDFEFRWLLAAFSASSFVCSVGVAAVARRGAASPERATRTTQPLFAGVDAVLRSPYLRIIAFLVFSLAATTSVVDFVFKAETAKAGAGSLIGFFAVFYTATGIATFVVQALLSKRVLQGLGVVPGVTILPIAIALFGGLALLSPELGTLTLLRA
ncbi:MAG: hypothetical protein AAF658_11085, partial [Myxococcota bacterium]